MIEEGYEALNYKKSKYLPYEIYTDRFFVYR